MRSVQENFIRLQEMDAKLNENTVSKDVEKLLTNKRRGSGALFTERVLQAKLNSSNAVGSQITSTQPKGEDDLASMADIYGGEAGSPVPQQSTTRPTSGRLQLNTTAPPASPTDRLGGDTADRCDYD
jgi:hypothetical protein